MKNLAILLIVLAGVMFASKVYVEKRYESELDDVIDRVRFFVDIRYDDIKVDFDGSISLNGLIVTYPQMNDSLKIQTIRAASSDRLMAFNGFSTFKDGKFPETFNLSINQMDIPIDDIERLSKKVSSSGSKNNQCRNFSTSFNYSDAGYSNLVSNLTVDLDFSDIYNTVVRVNGFDETSSFLLEWIIDSSKVESIAQGNSKELPITEVSGDFILESEAAERFIKHCADEFKVTPDVFLEKVVGSSKYLENSFGSDLGPQVREALVKFMRGGANFSFISKPSSQLKKFEQLQFYKPKDILRWLNLTATLDGEELPLRESVLAAEEEAKSKADELVSSSVKSKYTFIDTSNVNAYIGRWVRVSRTFGRKGLEGKLSGVADDDRLMVDMYKHGGLMTLTVGIDEIETIEVLKK